MSRLLLLADGRRAPDVVGWPGMGRMPSRRDTGLSEDLVRRAFETMGRYLAEREVLGEIAVYGGTAILLQFAWRRTTEDVDAVVLDAQREGVVKDAAAYAALRHGLAEDWLNNAVGAYTPLDEPSSFFTLFRSYPHDRPAGLRVLLARPEYLCAMKLKALQRADVGDRDFEDAVRLAAEIGCATRHELARLFGTFFPGETLDPSAERQLPEVAAAARQRSGT